MLSVKSLTQTVELVRSGSSACHVMTGLTKNVHPRERSSSVKIVNQLVNTFKR